MENNKKMDAVTTAEPTGTKIDVRVYPIEEPKGSTLAFASISIDDTVAIRGARVVNSDKGLFVAMPQSQDNSGLYHDIAFPVMKGLRQEINEAVLAEFVAQIKLEPEQRGYAQSEKDIGEEFVANGGRHAEDVKLDVKVFPIANPKGDTLAFAGVTIDDKVAINGIRVVGGKKGNFVSMPQSKDREGNFHDVAFPLSGDLRKEASIAVLGEFKQLLAERKQEQPERKPSMTDMLAAGREQAMRMNAMQVQTAAAKGSPGLGD
jgi:stage V sporulation protein G